MTYREIVYACLDSLKVVSDDSYITVDLKQVPAIAGEPCEGGTYLRSKVKIPSTMSIGTNTVYPVDFY